MISPPPSPQTGQICAPGGTMYQHPGQCLSLGVFGQYRDGRRGRRSIASHPVTSNRRTAEKAVRRVMLPQRAMVATVGHALPRSSA